MLRVSHLSFCTFLFNCWVNIFLWRADRLQWSKYTFEECRCVQDRARGLVFVERDSPFGELHFFARYHIFVFWGSHHSGNDQTHCLNCFLDEYVSKRNPSQPFHDKQFIFLWIVCFAIASHTNCRIFQTKWILNFAHGLALWNSEPSWHVVLLQILWGPLSIPLVEILTTSISLRWFLFSWYFQGEINAKLQTSN